MSKKNETYLWKKISVATIVPRVNVVLYCPHIPASIAVQVTVKQKFICLSW